MVETSNVSCVWSLAGTVAHLNSGALAGEIDVARPSVGIHQKEFDHGQVPCIFFGTHRSPEPRPTTHKNPNDLWWPLTIADSYIRGNDLVASYCPVDDWPYSPQLYWQAASLQVVDGVLGSMTHQVSVQTHLLDTHPKIDTYSQVPCREYLHITLRESGEANVELAEGEKAIAPAEEVSCVLWRLQAAPFSYAEIALPTDVREIAFYPAGQGRRLAVWRLFSEFLEKGVIRRARVHGAILPRENDVELALECCRAIEQSPLPLTT